MGHYKLTPPAKNDLREIIIYTVETWGKRQADKYIDILSNCFESLNDKDLLCQKIFGNVYVVHCEKHYVFFLKENPAKVIAILHNKMDLMERLKKRLEP